MDEIIRIASRSFSFNSSSNTSSETNIFKQISTPAQPSYFLNQITDPNCFYMEEQDNKDKLTKNFTNESKNLFDWELYVCSKRTFIPRLVNVENMKMTYDMKEIISLRMYLLNYKIDNLFINELISFVLNLKNSYHFIHGFLTIDSLFVKIDPNNLEFYVLEFENSILKDKPFRTNINNYKDLYSLYNSIYDRFPNESFIDYLYNNLPKTNEFINNIIDIYCTCLLYTSPSPRDRTRSRMPSSA